MRDESAIDVTNKFGIARTNGEFVFLLPVPRRLSEDDALLVAAYIVAMCANTERWKAILSAVCNA
jgi:hypothetical protein